MNDSEPYEIELLRKAQAILYWRLTGAGNEDAQALVAEIDRFLDAEPEPQ
jgi:hypothetical protein